MVKGDSHQQALRAMLSKFGVSAEYVEMENFGNVFAALEDRLVDVVVADLVGGCRTGGVGSNRC